MKSTHVAVAGAAVVAVAGLGALLLLGDAEPARLPARSATASPGPTTDTPGVGPDAAPRPTPPRPTPPRPTPSTSRPPPRPSTSTPPPATGPGAATLAPPRVADVAPPGEGAVVTLRCRDDQGEALGGVTVEVRRNGGAPLGTLSSDAQGQVALPRLPVGDRLEGAARHPRSRETVAFGPIEVRGPSVIDLRFQRAATGTLAGRILDEAGQPVRDATLVLVDPKQKGEARLDGPAMALGPDGSFRATVAAGSYAVNAEAPGFCASDRAYATVGAGDDAGPVELVVLRQGALEGTLRLPADVTAVLPVAVDLVVEVTRGTDEHPWQRVLRRPLEVDGGMRFVLEGCDPGAYRVRVEVPAPGQNRCGPWASATLAPGQRAAGLVLTLEAQAVAVAGRLRDDRGDPVEGATVSVRGRQARTDRDGRYAIAGLDPGDVAVEASKDGHAPGYFQATYEGVPLAVDLVLPRLGGVRGVVRDARGPAASVPVQVVLRADVGLRPYQASTDAQGAFLLEGLPPGRYFVKAGPGADPFDDAGAPAVDVRPGEVAEAAPITLP